ncbi:hypothetical protein [Halolamina salifodinae]|uniref:Uncharacterized protein n=1 Tax=Halolamina salifodinae TaxID=1202767 RepID=A0A8T4GY01_9EURY|nr:hypothetical protein [Halolamina salifodinae]MBP1986993.1 hypothetical protein [Halolamina salifodinae]
MTYNSTPDGIDPETKFNYVIELSDSQVSPFAVEVFDELPCVDYEEEDDGFVRVSVTEDKTTHIKKEHIEYIKTL